MIRGTYQYIGGEPKVYSLSFGHMVGVRLALSGCWCATRCDGWTINNKICTEIKSYAHPSVDVGLWAQGDV